MKRFFVIFQVFASILLGLSVNYLDAIEIPKHVEERYIQDVDNYEKFLREKGVYEEDRSASFQYPFVDTKNTRIFEFSQEIYKSISQQPHPCPEKIKEKKKLPAIQLEAESHYCPNCNLELTKSILESREQKHILALEGSDFGDSYYVEKAERGYLPELLDGLPLSNTYSYGIEDKTEETISDYVTLVLIANESKKTNTEKEWKELAELDASVLDKGANDHGAFITNLVVGGIRKTFSEPGTREALNRFYEQNPSLRAALQPLDEKIQKIAKNLKGGERVEAEVKAINEHITGEIFHKLMHGMTREMISGYVKKRPNMPPAIIRFLSPSELDLNNEEDHEVVDELFTTTFRNVSFAYNIASLYCTQSLNKDQPLRVVLGAHHAPAQKFLLEKIFPTTGPTPEIQIRNTYKTYMDLSPDQRKERIRHEISTLRNKKI